MASTSSSASKKRRNTHPDDDQDGARHYHRMPPRAPEGNALWKRYGGLTQELKVEARPGLYLHPEPPAHYQGIRQPPPSPPHERRAKVSLPSFSSLEASIDKLNPEQEQNTGLMRERPPSQSPTVESTLPRQHYPPSPPMSTKNGSDARYSPLFPAPARPVEPVSLVPAFYFHGNQHQMPHGPTRINSLPSMVVPSSPRYHNPPPPYDIRGDYFSAAQSSAPGPKSRGSSNQHARNPVGPPTTPIMNANADEQGHHHNPNPNYAAMAISDQHHHYMSQSSCSLLQTQDRYLCTYPGCDKAFSRPSSLRIHGHSHTGEKPYACPIRGCGKRFSVRSNMKRHEKGCHGGNQVLCYLTR